MNAILSPRLLIADPCRDNRWSLSLLARLSGCNVFAAATSAETLLLNDIVRPDVLLIEVMMPLAPAGYRLIEEMRRADDCPEIIVVTGYQTEEHLEQCRHLGVPHVLKPYCFTKLLVLVRERAAVRQQRDSAAAHHVIPLSATPSPSCIREVIQ